MHVAGSICAEEDDDAQSAAATSGDATSLPSSERLRQILSKHSIGARDVAPAHSATAADEDTLLFMAPATHFGGSCGERRHARHRRTRSAPVSC